MSIIQELGLLYDSSLMADDDAYELLEVQGQPTGIVELPPEWIRDDAVYFNMLRFSACAPTRRPRPWRRSSAPSSRAPMPRAGCSC
jgi:peptidoglycan-N-acetylglucosamine deacetylase